MVTPSAQPSFYPVATSGLIAAITQGDLPMVDAPLRTGADPNEVDEHGITALMQAIVKNQQAIAMRLIDDPRLLINQPNRYGQTALMSAATKGDVDVIRRLLQRGAIVDARNNQGTTALMFAAGPGHVEAVRTLLAAGANPQLTDSSSASSFTYAQKFPNPNQKTVMALLSQSMPAAIVLPSPVYIPPVPQASKENYPPQGRQKAGIFITEIENQSPQPVELLEEAGRNWEKLETVSRRMIPEGRFGAPTIVPLNMPLIPTEGTADLTITSLLGSVEVEVTDELKLHSTKTGTAPLAINAYRRAKIVIRPNGYIELAPVR